jgi:phage shock protein PspC (stress-responsive transcriptional regulator)
MEPRHQAVPTRQDTSLQPRLWRSRENKVFAGVIGGLAERLDVSATMLRWLAAFTDVMTGFFPGIFIYLVLWAITSPHPGDRGPSRSADQSSGFR